MGISRFVIALCAIPHAVNAQTFTCSGSAPDWTLKLQNDSATFAYFDRESTLDIPQQSKPEGADWPKAMTLIGPRDSAIVLLHNRACDGQSHEMQVLTQRGETPVLLTGCCQITPETE